MVQRSSSLLKAMFIALLVLAAANSIKCQVKGAEIYEIDYKGPETHSFWPPPRSSRSGPRLRPLKDRADRVRKPGHGLQQKRSNCRKAFMCG
ncbi:uncharacterized protein LOC110109616 [Dendrobium catenatum]|uniref:Uncharacterized protein n=1 Tax=Dendrobium catenatum TaxID=906689 RepID=A0A2I0WLJ5_9ASPA|nr:uncharacterized protein LOC110109616 [Dendrobium catenatum]PKU76529.1 hypothetical protein MA16_Dca001133 [Dendrobium catenatum]